MQVKFRIPEIAFGALLAVAVFAIGMTFQSSLFPTPNSQRIERTNKTEQQPIHKVTGENNKTQSLWVPVDSIGLYTIVLAVFTGVLAGVSIFQGFMLWRADKTTSIIANTASIQAKAAVNSERPFVYISEIELRLLKVAPESTDESYKAFFTFTNYGRTPAFVTSIGYGHALVDELPPIPEYRFIREISTEIVIRPGEPFEFEYPYVFFAVTAEQKKAIRTDKIKHWLWGNIRYRDFMNGEAENGFVAFQYPEIKVGDHLIQEAAFRLRGPEAYTYQRYSEIGFI